jgi:hypothetical protein
VIKGFSQYINEQYSDSKEIIDLKYGNPQLWQKEAMDNGSDLLNLVKDNGLMEKWKGNIPPLQDSEDAKKAIEELIMIGNAQTEEDKEFVKDAERDMLEIFVKFLKLNGVDRISKEDLEKVTDQIDPITFGLKYHFNYPRPYQLAFTLDLPLFPSQTTDACSPSYPSGHSIDSFVLGGILSKKFPQLRNGIATISERLSKSRLQGGIHFPFDAEFGRSIAEDILDLEFLSI